MPTLAIIAVSDDAWVSGGWNGSPTIIRLVIHQDTGKPSGLSNWQLATWLFRRQPRRHEKFLVSHNKGKAIDVKQVGRELGVRYLLEGSVRKIGNRVRITSQLIDTANATHVWAERYDRALDDIFALQDELTISVVGAIEPTLRRAEIERARRKRPDNLDAYDLYLRALPYVFTGMPETADKALGLLEQAIRLEPDYAAAHAFIAWGHRTRYVRGGLQQETKLAALRHAGIAIATGSDDATALAVAAFVIGALDRDYDTAFDAFDRALVLSPSSAITLAFGSLIHTWAGDDATAIEQAEQALRLSPFDSLIYITYLALSYAHWFTGRFDEALSAANRSAQANPQFSVACVLQAAAFASLGRIDEAKASAQRALALEPTFTIGFGAGPTSPVRNVSRCWLRRGTWRDCPNSRRPWPTETCPRKR